MLTILSGNSLRRLEGFELYLLDGKLSPYQLAQVEKRLKNFRSCRPYEFDRYVGLFSQCRKYKSHVLHQFLYYSLFSVFKALLMRSVLSTLCFFNMLWCLLAHTKLTFQEILRISKKDNWFWKGILQNCLIWVFHVFLLVTK